MLIRIMTPFSNFLFIGPFGSGSLLCIKGQILINLDDYLTGMNTKGKQYHRTSFPSLPQYFVSLLMVATRGEHIKFSFYSGSNVSDLPQQSSWFQKRKLISYLEVPL